MHIRLASLRMCEHHKVSDKVSLENCILFLNISVYFCLKLFLNIIHIIKDVLNQVALKHPPIMQNYMEDIQSI